MKAFARLCESLDQATVASDKLAALAAYFRTAPAADAGWAVHLLSGHRPGRLVPSGKLRAWAAEAAGIPDWLFEESYGAVGDLAETITLLLPDIAESGDRPLAWWVEERLLPLRAQAEPAQKAETLAAWRELGRRERYVWNKLVTGSFRTGASGRLVVRALAEVSGVDEGTIGHRLVEAWEPSPECFERLVSADTRDADVSRPYPFQLARPLEQAPASLGDPAEWVAEWTWGGIRSQLVRRAGRTFLWSGAEEPLSGRFPEIEAAGALLPDGTVLDGELLPWDGASPLPLAELQRRVAHRNLGRKILSEVPVVLAASDLLEHRGEDLRGRELAERRERLAALLAATPSAGRIVLSPLVDAADWDAVGAARARAREAGAEGLVLKPRSSLYGRWSPRGDWWMWKADALSVDAVLLYAQPGNGRRTGLYTDYTFGVWDGDRLVPLAKAHTGLTDEEIRRVDAFVRRNTREKFGPVRTVKPELVFELAFEGIQRSTRHKSGVAVRVPRVARWRTDKRPEEADTLERVRSLLDEHGVPRDPGGSPRAD